MTSTIIAALSLAYWLGQAFLAWRSARVLRSIPQLPAPTRTEWPTLSMVVPARDEGATVKHALRAKLNEGYPALEIVFVDDRSSDDTGAEARALAKEDPRLTVTRVDSLPDGWLGKLNALQQGLVVSKGEWILFSDADVHLAPGTLEKVINWAESERIDHIAALPSIEPGDFLTNLSLAPFFRFVVTFPRLWAVEDPHSSAAVGIGAFNLFRRSALERTAGLEQLKMTIADDMELGVMLKRAGAAQRVVLGREAVSLQFYASFAELTHALEKNGASAPAVVTLAGLSVLVALELGWMAAFFVAWPLGLAALAITVSIGWGLAKWLGHPRWPALFPGVSFLPLAWVLVRSTVLAWVRGGVVWRGTFYPRGRLR